MRNVITSTGPDLEEDIQNDEKIIGLCADIEVAKQFYAAMCNVHWKKEKVLAEDELLVERLKGTEHQWWLCTWRAAGGIIAGVRFLSIGAMEDYMDFYCGGNEGVVTELVRENLGRIGWTPNESDVL